MSVTPISEKPPQLRTGLKLWPILAAGVSEAQTGASVGLTSAQFKLAELTGITEVPFGAEN